MSEHKKPNELVFVPSATVALDNIDRNRRRGATNLATLFEHLEFRQLLKRRSMYRNHYLPSPLPNIKISIAHSVFRILPLAPRIAYHSSSSISAGIRSARLPY